MPGFNVEVFKSEISKRNGIMRNNRFLMTFVPPTVSVLAMTEGQDTASIGRSMEYWCEAVALPGYQLVSGDVRRWTYGPHEKRPFGPNVVPLQTLFLSDGNGDMFKFFHSWMNNIIPHYVSTSFDAPQDGSPKMYPYEIRYKNEYVTDIHIYVYDESGKEKLHYVIKEAFPSHVIDIPMAWEATNSHMKFQVTFDYLDWYLEKPRNAESTIGELTGIIA